MKPSQVEWLTTYETWSDGIEASLATDRSVSRTTCESTFDDQVGDPPNERLEEVATAGRGSCAALTPDGWQSGQLGVVRALMAVHGELLPPRPRGEFAEIASSRVGVEPDVYCWQPEAWASLLEHLAIVRGGEETSLRGLVDGDRARIDLDPGVCVTLDRYLRRIRPSAVTYQNFELAEALVVLTHEAEHLKAPAASEVDVECYAVQHVRPLIRANGWGDGFAEEIALHAWELSYLPLPRHFRTPECRDGRSLDRNPGSSAWP